MKKNTLHETKPRINWVDTAKAISILLVVILHVRNEFALFSIQSATLDRLVDISTNLRMPLFFAVSGLFAGKWLRSPWQLLLNRKAALLIWVFLAWQPIILFYKLLNHWALGSFSSEVLISELIRTLLSPMRPNGELWFLWTLVIFFLFARLTRDIPSIYQLIGSIFVSALWMSVIEAMMPELVFRAIGSGWNGFFRYYFLFIGFALFSVRIISFISHCKWYTSLFFFAVWFFAAFTVSYFDIPSSATLFLLTILGVVGGLGLARIISNISVFQYLGKNTLQIYLGHTTLIAIFTCTVYLSGLIPWVQDNIWTSALILVGLALLGSLMISQFNFLKNFYRQPNWFSLEYRKKTSLFKF